MSRCQVLQALGELLDINCVAKRLGCRQRNAWRLHSEGLLPESIKIAGGTCWLASEVDAYIAAGKLRLKVS